MFESLKNHKRLLIEADLLPVQGDRFQPTGFADLGAATYQLPDGTPMLLVESAQSVANRLEATIIGPDNELVEELSGLSYIRAKLEGARETKTNSLMEAHRVNSPFIIGNKAFENLFIEESGYKKMPPIDWRKVAAAVFKYDLNSLLHGVFLAKKGLSQIRFARTLSGFVEARDVREVVSGGVKNNPADPQGNLRAVEFDDKEVYSNVPYQRMEYTAATIRAYFNLDLGLLSSYDLGDDAFELLVFLALLKVRRFLSGGPRLRTACDFRLKSDLLVTAPAGFAIPDEATLLAQVQQKIRACAGQFANPPVTEITTPVKMSK